MEYLRIKDILGISSAISLSSKSEFYETLRMATDAFSFSSEDEMMDETFTFVRYHVWPRYYMCYIIRNDGESTTGTMTWLAHFANYLRYSQDRYGRLAKIYNDQLSNLMKQVETKEGNSDMPQSSSLSDLSSDSQVDVLSSARVRLTDGGTTMERLKEIEENLDSIYDEWCKDFYEKCCML